MDRRNRVCQSGALVLALTLTAAACDRMDPVGVDGRTTPRPAATIVPTPGGDLSITTVALQVPAGRLGMARDVNSTGVIVGYYLYPLGTEPDVPVRWDPSGTMTPLPVPAMCAGRNADARGVNEAGDIVGACMASEGGQLVTHAVLWPRGGSPVVLTTPPGTTSAFASGVNNKGDVVGGATAAGGYVPVLWSKGQVQILALPSGYGEGFAARISTSGLIAGNTVAELPAFVWDKGAPRLLPIAEGWTSSSVWGITSAGVSVGTLVRTSPSYATLPTKWDRLGTATAVPIDAPANSPQLYDISNGGWMIGGWGLCSPAACAFLWSEATGTVPLTFPGTSGAVVAVAISDPGYIVGYDGGIGSTGPALLWIVTLAPITTP